MKNVDFQGWGVSPSLFTLRTSRRHCTYFFVRVINIEGEE
nr:MAG TPA: Honey bee toxin [Caudoviricetes sp.]